jgi:hypothetical protein
MRPFDGSDRQRAREKAKPKTHPFSLHASAGRRWREAPDEGCVSTSQAPTNSSVH